MVLKLLQTTMQDTHKTTMYLKDYDAYRHQEMGFSLTDVLNYASKKMGHAFVL